MSGAVAGKQFPHLAITWAAKVARLCWRVGRPLGRATRARACFHGGDAVGFDVGLDCIVTCVQCGRAFQVGATLDQADGHANKETPWLLDCGKMRK